MAVEQVLAAAAEHERTAIEARTFRTLIIPVWRHSSPPSGWRFTFTSCPGQRSRSPPACRSGRSLSSSESKPAPRLPPDAWRIGSGCLIVEPVANPWLRHDVPRMRRIRLQFLAQLTDQDAKVLRLSRSGASPDGAGDPLVRQHAAGLRGEQGEQVELFRCQADF